MKNAIMRPLAAAVVMIGLAFGTLYAQQHDHPATAAPGAKPAAQAQAKPAAPAAKAAEPEIFCATMKTGALCPTGTLGALRLSPDKREQWLQAIQKYNDAVDKAIKQLETDSKTVLTPAQITQMNKWFAVGLNAQMNQILGTSATQ